MGGLYSSGGTGIRRRDEPGGDDFQAHHRRCQDFILLITLRNVTCSFRFVSIPKRKLLHMGLIEAKWCIYHNVTELFPWS